MFNKAQFQKIILPHLLIVVGFFLITIFFFRPAFFSGKELKQGDIIAYKGASKEIVDHRNQKGEEPLWTNRMFGGMPAYQISTEHNSNLPKAIAKAVTVLIPHPFHHLLFAFLSFYGLALILGFSPWLAGISALAFGLSSYNILLYEAGHNSKIEAIAFMPMVVGALILISRKKYLLGGVLFALFFSLEISANHLQITYYLGFICAFLLVYFFVDGILKREFKHLYKSALVLMTALTLGLATNASLLWTTYTYKDQTIRGKSELSSIAEGSDATSGLDKSYITQWSYGKAETFSLLVPNFKGGSSGSLSEEKAALKQVNRKYRDTVGGMDKYFGAQPFTSGPIYFGAVVCLLFVLSLFMYKGPLFWPLLLVSLLAITLSWGKNFMILTDFFIQHVPLYNNFRAVSMTLVIAQFTFPVLAFLGLRELLSTEAVEKHQKTILFAGTSITVILLFFVLLPGASNEFFKPSDPLVENSLNEQAQLKQELIKYSWPENQQKALLEGLEKARKFLFVSDVKRSLAFVVLSWLVILAYSYRKISKNIVFITLGVLVLFDLWGIDNRYLKEENYAKKKVVELPFLETPADQFILAQEQKGRVLNLAVNTFNDASTSYFHESVGGYSAVKLRRYQELYDFALGNSFNEIKTALSSGLPEQVNLTLSKQHVLNLLNTKFLIYNPSAAPIVNPYSYGKAWFVSDVDNAKTADEELKMTLKGVKEKAVLSVAEMGNITQDHFQLDSSQKIIQTAYQANELVYEVNSSKEALLVFSEIFYKDGWKAYIDEKEQAIARVNYVLRSLQVPAGKHTILFKFEPSSYRLGSNIGLFSSLVILLALVILLWQAYRKSKLGERKIA